MLFRSADTALKAETGKDAGSHVFAMFESKKAADVPEIALAEAAPTAHDATAAASPMVTAAAETTSSTITTKPTAMAPTKAAVSPVSAKAHTPFPFAMNNRRTPSNGVGGSYIALESRANISVPAWSGSGVTLASTTSDSAPKIADKAALSIPDLKTLAGNPDLVKQLKANGLKTSAKADAASQSTPSAAPATTTPSTTAPGSSDAVSAATNNGQSGDYANLMARNLERYMSLQNKRPAANRVDQRF